MDRIRQSDFHDQYITCVDCGDEFTWTAGEQAFFASKGLAPPKRCKPCRDYRRASLVIGDIGSERQ